ncbi:TPA: RNA-processing protein [archaeon]|nr:RNA-processing protein [Candidatus Naiadarchaeales archaeon SRR2090153.bin461]HIK02727.1 RNA-processing protein [Candidatus Naiadarchaeales archaeon SRR2090159.bin1288]
MVAHVKIPKERLRVLLAGKDTVQNIEAATHTKLEVNRDTEEVEILEQEKGNAFEELRAADVVKAIGRGFVAKTAFRLLEEDAILVVIDITEFIGKKKNTIERIKGRIIGTHGKSKRRIADMTNTDIVVYGKTVSIIGKAENALLAQKAIETLCNGSMHSTVFRIIERGAGKL